ncbi:hypothetical protein NO1_1330, partial [Candidatus Termititenax aidoneus]
LNSFSQFVLITAGLFIYRTVWVLPWALLISLILAVGVFFAGYNPYITNFLHHGTPLFMWPVAKLSLMEYFKNCAQYLLALLFFNNPHFIPFSPWKLLYLSNGSGLKRYLAYDAGFGLFFLEICFLAVCLFCSGQRGRVNKKELGAVVLFPCFLILFISAVSFLNYCRIYGEGGYLARFIPYLWYIFCFPLLKIDFAAPKCKTLAVLFAALVLLNNGLLFGRNTTVALIRTVVLRRNIAEIRTLPEEQIAIVLDEAEFRHAIEEKLNHFKVAKSFLFTTDDKLPHKQFTRMKAIRVAR